MLLKRGVDQHERDSDGHKVAREGFKRLLDSEKSKLELSAFMLEPQSVPKNDHSMK